MNHALGETQEPPISLEELSRHTGSCSNCDWTPTGVDGYLWPTEGERACNWMEDNLVLGEGDYYGEPMILREDQANFVYRWYEFCPRCGYWHYDRALRLAATGDGKTQFYGGIIVLDFAGPKGIAPESPNIPVAAASWEQADLLFKAVSIMCGGTKDAPVPQSPLYGHFNVRDAEITFADGRPGRIFRTAAVAGTNEGGLPTLFACDEIHEWGALGDTKARRHTVISKSTRKRNIKLADDPSKSRGPGRVINISTAGFDRHNSMLGAMYMHAKRVIHNPELDPKFLADIYEAPDGLNYDDPKDREIAVRAASHGADVIWNVKDRVNSWNDPTLEHHEWIRYYANRWVDVAEDSWMKDHPQAWMRCKGDFLTSTENPFVISVDMALKHDSVAVEIIEILPDGRTAVTPRFWRANEHGGRIPHTDVWKYIKSRATGLGFRGVVYDPRYFEVPAKLLEEAGILTIEFDQNPQRMSPACGMAYDKILAKSIVHDGDPDLWQHVNGACRADQERGGFTLRKSKSKGHIDGAIALCMGVWVLHAMDTSPFRSIHGRLHAG
jgi:phage terminase large subunit-like protein